MHLYNLLYWDIRIVDLRSAADYSRGHIKGSHNLPIESLDGASSEDTLKTHIERFERAVCAEWGTPEQQGDVVLLGGPSSSEDAGQDGSCDDAQRVLTAVAECYLARNARVRRVHLLRGGYAAFAAAYACRCSATSQDAGSDLLCYPSQISDRVFLGSSACRDPTVLSRLGIKRVIALMDEKPPPVDGVECFYVHLVDDERAQLVGTCLDQCLTLLATPFFSVSSADSPSSCASSVPPRVLVHCARGVSRSASVVIAHHMLTNRICYDDALAYVRTCRAVVRPNAGFERQLREWQLGS